MNRRPKDYLTPVQLILGLNEEASELATATAKLLRVIDGGNPTPVTYEQAHERMLEEAADALNYMSELFSIADWDAIARVRESKMERWMERLEDRNEQTAEASAEICTEEK